MNTPLSQCHASLGATSQAYSVQVYIELDGGGREGGKEGGKEGGREQGREGYFKGRIPRRALESIQYVCTNHPTMRL